MNLEEYKKQVQPLIDQISSTTNNMMMEFHRLYTENAETLFSLSNDFDFQFLDRDNQIIPIEDNRYIQLFKVGNTPVYLNPSSKEVITLEYNSELGMNLPSVLTDYTIQNTFRDVNHYLDAIHIVGLDGILQQDIKNKQLITRDLSTAAMDEIPSPGQITE